MSAISAYFEKAMLDWGLQGATPTRPTALWAGLAVGTPTSVSGSEMGTLIGLFAAHGIVRCREFSGWFRKQHCSHDLRTVFVSGVRDRRSSVGWISSWFFGHTLVRDAGDSANLQSWRHADFRSRGVDANSVMIMKCRRPHILKRRCSIGYAGARHLRNRPAIGARLQ